MRLLGVLAEGPRTGYGLVRHLAQSIAYTWPASHSQVYPELAKLREAGLIREGAAAPRGGRVYELTDAGLDGGAPLAARDGAVAHRPRRGVAAALLPLAARARGGRGVPARRGRARPGDAGGAGGDRRAARIRTTRRPAPTAPRSSSACDTTRARIDVGRGRRSQHPPAARSVTTITSSTRTPKRPSRRIDGSSVNVIPASSGVSSSTERNGRSCTSSPIPWPIRWRKPSPSPAASIGARQAALTSRASAPGRAAARPASCASSSTTPDPPRTPPAARRRQRCGRSRSSSHSRRRRSRRGRPRRRGARRACPAPPESSRRSPQVKMCVGKEGQREPRTSSSCSTRSTSVRHRDAGDDVRRHRGHRLARDQARLRHQLELGVRLHAPQLVDERRALLEPGVGDDREQLDHRLRPEPLPERDPPSASRARPRPPRTTPVRSRPR